MIELVTMIVAVVLAHDRRDEAWWDRRYEYLERSENGWTWFPGLSG